MRVKTRGFICGLLIFLTGLLTYQVQGMALPPERHSVAVGEPLKIYLPAPLDRNVKGLIAADENGVFSSGPGLGQTFDPNSGPVVSRPGQFQLKLSLFGVIPVRDVIVNAVPEVRVYPGGQSIGVLIHSQGVIVVDLSPVLDQGGNKCSPAADAGLKKGDVILKIDGEAVRSDLQVKELVARAGTAGQPLSLEVKRGGEVFMAKVGPVFCRDTMRYRLGLLIRDSAAGVGTLTFYEPQSMAYGALGHVINDIGTTKPVELSDGKIINARVQGIHRGKKGQPGEKIGMFQGEKQISGTISKNTRMGIFGCLLRPPEVQDFKEPIPVATAGQIREGEAEILTVIDGEKVERFLIEIVKVNPYAKQDGKGLVIRITDQKLLEKTGGIIQGMSGSPIIQDNKLVGAVTHVFVNDPTRGYGVPVEWMLEEVQLIPADVQEQIAG